jgi:phage shock protein PspC (stress-responsive transcriptional regulator)
MNTNRLSRSRADRMLGGVCGGLGKYLNIDSNLVRLFFVLFTLTGGFGVLLYLALWLILPVDDEMTEGSSQSFGPSDIGDRARGMGADLRQAMHNSNPNTAKILGIGLVVVGAVFLVQNLNIPWLHWLRTDIFWPALLILAGAALVFRAVKKE